MSSTDHRACRATRRATAALHRLGCFMVPVPMAQIVLQEFSRLARDFCIIKHPFASVLAGPCRGCAQIPILLVTTQEPSAY